MNIFHVISEFITFLCLCCGVSLAGQCPNAECRRPVIDGGGDCPLACKCREKICRHSYRTYAHYSVSVRFPSFVLTTAVKFRHARFPFIMEQRRSTEFANSRASCMTLCGMLINFCQNVWHSAHDSWAKELLNRTRVAEYSKTLCWGTCLRSWGLVCQGYVQLRDDKKQAWYVISYN